MENTITGKSQTFSEKASHAAEKIEKAGREAVDHAKSAFEKASDKIKEVAHDGERAVKRHTENSSH